MSKKATEIEVSCLSNILTSALLEVGIPGLVSALTCSAECMLSYLQGSEARHDGYSEKEIHRAQAFVEHFLETLPEDD